MKTILLMSCILCAGMNGYGNGMEIQRISGANDVSEKTINSVPNSGSDTITEDETEPEPHQKGFSVVRTQEDRMRDRALDQLMQNLEVEIGLLLNSETELTDSKIKEAINTIFRNHKKEGDMSVFGGIESCLHGELDYDYGTLSTMAAAEKILDVLNGNFFEKSGRE